MNPTPRLPVFVYGTLRAGEKNYPKYLEGRTQRESSATVAGELYFVAKDGYPCLTTGEGKVRGQLMELRPEFYEATLQALDALEEYDPNREEESDYLRRRVQVTLDSGNKVEAWVYYWNGHPPTSERIPSGDFRRR